jgi:hypothetical protein
VNQKPWKFSGYITQNCKAKGKDRFLAWVCSICRLVDAVMSDRVATPFAGGFGKVFLGGNADEVGASPANPAVSQPQERRDFKCRDSTRGLAWDLTAEF